MAENTAFNTVTVDIAGRASSHFNLNHPVSASLPFGWVAPTLVHKMVPGSKHVVSTKSLCRLEPMVLPVSQGQISIDTLHQFVGMSDLFRNYSAFQSQQPFATARAGVTTFPKLPSMRLCDLSMYILVGCKFQIYYDGNAGATVNGYEEWSDLVGLSAGQISVADAIKHTENLSYITLTGGSDASFNFLYPDYGDIVSYNRRIYACVFNPLWRGSSSNHPMIPVANVGTNLDDVLFGTGVDIGNCDIVIERDDIYAQGEDNPMHIAFAINLSDFGKRLLFILDAAGYGYSFSSQKLVDLSRLFAIYVAYYGAYGLSKYMNYESTWCSQFLRSYENGASNFNYVSVDYASTTLGQSTYLNGHFVRFLEDLVWMFSTDKVDYISSHRASDVTTPDESGWIGNVVIAPNGPSLGQNSNTDVEPSSPRGSTWAPYINLENHTQVDADLLKLLYKVTNRNTVAGRRIAELLRAGGYGAYVDEQKSHFIGKSSFSIDIADVNATSDSTSSVTGKSSMLGQYVGKGVGVSQPDRKFVYDTDEFGYWITLTSVIPDSSYCQQMDMTVFDYTDKQQYNREFDSCGYEFNSKHVVLNGQDWTVVGVKNGVFEPCKLDDAFGLVPRFMRYKVAQGKILGDFRRRSTRSGLLPFVLSKYIDVNNKYTDHITKEDSGNSVYHLTRTAMTDELPIGGQAWRYLNKYPWLANFDRIFAYTGKMPSGYAAPALMARYLYCNYTQDSFNLFMYFMHSMEAPMLPISDSYSTTDDNDGKGKSMTVA